MFPSTGRLRVLSILLIITAGYSGAACAEAVTPPFYRQLYPDTHHLHVSDDHTDAYAADQTSAVAPIGFSVEENLDYQFNYLWVQQHQRNYDHHEGTAALGKLFRMGIKSLYQQYRGNGSAIKAGKGDDDITSELGGMEYKLRLNESKVSLGVDYSF